MSNWAIVIGIDTYVDWPKGTLGSAVGDALLMRRWLLQPAPVGGGVQQDQIYTLLSPKPGAKVDNAPADFDSPTFVNVKKAIANLGNRTNAGAQRCFFYFSGHGISNFGGTLGYDDAICFSDFSPAEASTGNSLPTADIFAKFREFPFKEQFFFIDACRDMPWTGLQPLFGRFGYTVRLDGVRPVAQQARLYATTSGARAAEVGDKGKETGAFTSTLLKGLAGTGSAKYYQAGTGKYVVRTDSLFKYVRATVTAMKLAAGDDGRSVQTPEMDTGSGGQEGGASVLAELPPDAARPVDLTVHVDPEDATPDPPARISVTRDEKEVAGADWTRAPITFTLPPREYGLVTDSKKYVQDPDPDAVDVYDITIHTLRWRPRPQEEVVEQPPLPPAPPPPPVAGAPAWDAPLDAAESDAGAEAAAAAPPGWASAEPPSLPQPRTHYERLALSRDQSETELRVSASDSLAFIEITDSSGALVAQGHGQVVATNLDPGFYRARLSLPYRKPVEKLVSVALGTKHEVRLPAPRAKGRVAEELIPSGHAYQLGDGAVGVSEIVGNIAAPRIGTVLGLASVFADFPDSFQGAGSHLSTLGVSERFRPSTLHVVIVGDPRSSPKGEIGLRVSPMGHLDHGSDVELKQLSLPAAVNGRITLPAGQYGLHLRLGNSRSTILPVSVFADAITRVLIELPSDHGATTVIHLSKPGLSHNLFRRIDLLERSAMSGQLTSAIGLIDQLEASNWADPAVYAVAGFVRLRMGQAQELQKLAGRMTKLWPKVGDGWVLQALASGGDRENDPRRIWMRGLDAEIPMIAETTVVLAEAADHYDIDHPKRELLQTISARSIPGTFWTAWSD